MIIKLTIFSASITFLTGTTLCFAEDYTDLCGSNIEGVTVSMSKAQAHNTWVNKGYILATDSDNSLKNTHQSESIKSLLFQTVDRQPNTQHINSVGWVHTASTGRTKIFANYVAPKAPNPLKSYEAFYRSKLTNYCTHEIDAFRSTAPPQIENPRFSRLNPNPMSRTHEFCENVLQNKFRSDNNGHAQKPPSTLHITDAKGCRVTYGNLNLRGFASGFRIGIEQTR